MSFGLSMLFAFRSGPIPFSEFKSIIASVLTYFANRPLVFVWPPKHQPTEEVEAKEDN